MPYGLDELYYHFPVCENKKYYIGVSLSPFSEINRLVFKKEDPNSRTSLFPVVFKKYKELVPYYLSINKLENLIIAVVDWFGLSLEGFTDPKVYLDDYILNNRLNRRTHNMYRRLFILLIMTYYPNTDKHDLSALMNISLKSANNCRVCQLALKAIKDSNEELQIYRQMELVRELVLG